MLHIPAPRRRLRSRHLTGWGWGFHSCPILHVYEQRAYKLNTVIFKCVVSSHVSLFFKVVLKVFTGGQHTKQHPLVILNNNRQRLAMFSARPVPVNHASWQDTPSGSPSERKKKECRKIVSAQRAQSTIWDSVQPSAFSSLFLFEELKHWHRRKMFRRNDYDDDDWRRWWRHWQREREREETMLGLF